MLYVCEIRVCFGLILLQMASVNFAVRSYDRCKKVDKLLLWAAPKSTICSAVGSRRTRLRGPASSSPFEDALASASRSRARQPGAAPLRTSPSALATCSRSCCSWSGPFPWGPSTGSRVGPRARAARSLCSRRTCRSAPHLASPSERRSRRSAGCWSTNDTRSGHRGAFRTASVVGHGLSEVSMDSRRTCLQPAHWRRLSKNPEPLPQT